MDRCQPELDSEATRSQTTLRVFRGPVAVALF